MTKVHKIFSKTLAVTMVSISIFSNLLTPASIVYAGEEEMQGYVNPQDIVIASPANKYSTTASKVSILGACDYIYPLYLNGEQIETTEYGFFTTYVELSVGENNFTFENNGKLKTLTIIRKKTSTSSGNSSGTSSANSYKAYKTDTYGIVTDNYAMPRTTVNDSDINCMPLTKGTTFRILGEEKGYYKIADGTYLGKSSVSKYNKAIPENKVSHTKMLNNKETNQLVTELTMNINTLYEVYFEGQEVSLTLYQTVAAKGIVVPANDVVKEVSISTDKKHKKVTYTFHFYDGATVLGYDVLFNNGIMKFELKKAPKLEEKGSLVGATVFLDAGHGDNDPGTVGALGKYGPLEKDINLNITIYAKEYLEKLGAKVVLSRDEDEFYSLSERVSMIRNLRPDISVSIHGNSLDYSSDYSKTSGFITYYSYSIEGDVPEVLNESISNTLGFTPRKTRQKSLSLTRLTTCPSVLLETMFLSNPGDYEYLLKAENQKSFGNAIGKAIQEYLESNAAEETLIYTVKKGDSLKRIAKAYGVTVDTIVKYNQIKNINYIYVGQTLEIPQ
jgi:N-acetylmuramoyl-L-alanine amidase